MAAGASILVLGAFAPNHADAATGPGLEQNSSDVDVSDTLTICLADEQCDYGVADSNPASAYASVSDVATGQIRQTGLATGAAGTVDLAMTNAGSASVSAVAEALAPARSAYATAMVSSAVYQAGIGGGDVMVDLSNDGDLHIGAIADASGTNATASAGVAAGIVQNAISTETGEAAVTLDNGGDLTIAALAAAHGTGTAGGAELAVASISGAIFQTAIANGGLASATLDNQGNLSIAAGAAVDGGSYGTAIAALNSAVEQTGYGAEVGLTLANSGNLSAVAAAEASASGSAYASAVANGVLGQRGQGENDVALDIANDGTMTIAATANAAGQFATAYAVLGDGIVQNAESTGAGNVDVALANGGGLSIGAAAQAEGEVAAAVGYVENGVAQNGGADGMGDLTLTLANSGDMAVEATASAVGDYGAWALAIMNNAIVQHGIAADGEGTALIDNDGSIQIIAQADASADGVSDAGGRPLGAWGSATATAVVSAALVQDVQGELGADATLANSGDISIVASAEASSISDATGTGVTIAPLAVAVVENGVYQISRSEGGDASVELENAGNFNIVSTAKAESDSGPALALAIASSAIHQEASAFGDVSIDLTNSGNLSIGAEAEATGPIASAIAVAYTAIHQNSFATGEGDAAASLHNDGSLQIAASASANGSGVDGTGTGYGRALAINGAGVVLVAQNGVGSGDTDVTLDNGGTIDIVAVANAQGGEEGHGFGRSTPVGASATAIVTAAIIEGAIGEANSSVSLTNSGELTVAAVANATGPDGADASAFGASSSMGQFAGAVVGGGVLQVAIGENADVTLSNQGSFDLLGVAHAESVAAGPAQAFVSMYAAVTQYAAAIGGDAQIMFENEGTMVVAAQASAEAADAGVASALGQIAAEIVQTVVGDGALVATVANEGDIVISVDAAAVANGDAAYADALSGQLVRQTALYTGTETGTSGYGELLIDNSGSLLIGVHAQATGLSAFANATMGTGISQFQSTRGDAAATISNSGTLVLHNAGEAHASGGRVEVVGGIAAALRQRSIAQNDASVSIDNEGDIGIIATAEGAGATDEGLAGEVRAIAQLGARTFIGFVGAIDQSAFGDQASANLSNSGSIQLMTDGSASGASANTNSRILIGVEQIITSFAGDATATFDNQSEVTMVANAEATAAAGHAFAGAEIGNGIDQWVNAIGGDATASINNDGEIDIASLANASGDGAASASAIARGFSLSAQLIGPRGSGGEALASFTNAGDVMVEALASAHGGSAVDNPGGPGPIPIPRILGGGSAPAADAFANAVGLGAAAANVAVANSGSMIIHSGAEAEGPLAASATALAQGMYITPVDWSDGSASMIVDNSGDLSIIADARAEGATGWAYAEAIGVRVFGSSAAHVEGTFDNGGNLLVSANAEVDGIGSAYANAVGIDINVGSVDLDVVNSGVLMVSASSNSGSASATAIQASSYDPGEAGNITITNDGGVIIARQSADRNGDGSATWLRGTAIDTRFASGVSTINLAGNGAIYGNIEIANGDIINVTGGETSFNGVIKTDCPRNPCTASLLNIGEGGSLFLRAATGGDAPTAVYVGELNVAADGTLIFELPTGGAANALAPGDHYSQIFADVANLDGTLLLRSASGLYSDSQLFEDVIDANVVNGEFARCGIEGDPALLSLHCVYDDQGNVDLTLDRVAFNAVGLLGHNQEAVGSGIEAVYDLSLDGAFGDLVAQLFTLDSAGYRLALTQLAGTGHAAYLQSFHNLGVDQNDLIDRAVGCELPGTEASSLSCRTGKISVWGQLDLANRRNDGDAEAAGYDADRWMAPIGIDARVADDMVIGASLTRISNKLDFHDGSDWKAEGYQIGAYGIVDQGNFYAKGMVSLGWFDGDSDRIVDLTPLGANVVDLLSGDTDTRLWTLGARLGYRLPTGAKSQLTPFVNVDHSSATLKALTEAGTNGTALTIEKSTSWRTALTAGAKWATDLGGAIPEFTLGYRHLLGDRRVTFHGAFADAPGSDFSIMSAEEKKGSLLAGASLGGKAGPFDVRVGYQGLFDGRNQTHSGSFRIALPLGGK